MHPPNRRLRRPGAYAVETAFVLPVLVLLLLGLVVGGTGVFRYQQVASQAREAARWACVRGGDYERDTEQEPPSQDRIFEQAVLPHAAGMDPARITLLVQWVDLGTNTAHDWDGAPRDVKSVTPEGEYVTNRVRVTVTYRWEPGLVVGPLTLSSVCELPMSF